MGGWAVEEDGASSVVRVALVRSESSRNAPATTMAAARVTPPNHNKWDAGAVSVSISEEERE
jgi:hypothetical protein